MAAVDGPGTGRDGFSELLGIEYLKSVPGEAHGRVEVTDSLRQPFGIVHGGVYASLAESVCSTATYAAVGVEGHGRDRAVQRHERSCGPIGSGHVDAVARARHTRPHDLGLGRRAHRRPGPPLRPRADERRRPAEARAPGGRLAAVAVGDRHPPVAAERRRGDLDPRRRLAALVLGAVDQSDHLVDDVRGRAPRRPSARGLGLPRRRPRGSGRAPRRAAASRRRAGRGAARRRGRARSPMRGRARGRRPRCGARTSS